MKYKGILIGIIFVILFLIIINKIVDCSHNDYCKEFGKQKFNGKIVNKYIDTNNHNYQMLIIQKYDLRDSLAFNTDLSGFYDYIKTNDTVEKVENSNEIKIINRDTSFFINFDCK